ncbi:Ethylene-responsive transcription factor ERF012 [Apostasia shenzhenica]|uniref:Ethylene-responsive transcription factor ERF012 n=1 Tax=Apostasia shenzhenica TaxID=1088818 RepID=A0A2I0B7I7_9ASPA|nr:Ethylene-responsive transcription factor ERF012 [Apostasia shenzhenica]
MVKRRSRTHSVGSGGAAEAGSRQRQYKGVRMRSWGSWVSEIRAPNQKTRIWLGSYSTPEAAARAYDAAVLCLKGSSAALNFPDSSPLPLPAASILSPKSIQRIAAAAAAASTTSGGVSTLSSSPPSISSDENSASICESSLLAEQESSPASSPPAAADPWLELGASLSSSRTPQSPPSISSEDNSSRIFGSSLSAEEESSKPASSPAAAEEPWVDLAAFQSPKCFMDPTLNPFFFLASSQPSDDLDEIGDLSLWSFC